MCSFTAGERSGLELQRLVGTKRKCATGHITKKKTKTVLQLPPAVRSTQFAQFMLGGRFKMRPEDELLKTPELKLYNFPRFNRCDALMYFPSTMVSFMNNGDLSALSELFKSFCHQKCEVRLPATVGMGNANPASRFVEFQQLLCDLHPDKIMCMHSTKEVGNEIRADLYFKLIENKTIYESVARTNRKDSYFAPFMVPSRADHLKQKFLLYSLSEAELAVLTELLDSGADVELFGKIDMRLVFNQLSKRVLELKLVAKLTHFRRVDIADITASHDDIAMLQL